MEVRVLSWAPIKNTPFLEYFLLVLEDEKVGVDAERVREAARRGRGKSFSTEKDLSVKESS